jgi:hypothetical protein
MRDGRSDLCSAAAAAAAVVDISLGYTGRDISSLWRLRRLFEMKSFVSANDRLAIPGPDPGLPWPRLTHAPLHILEAIHDCSRR